MARTLQLFPTGFLMLTRFSLIFLSGFLALIAHAGEVTPIDKVSVLGVDANANGVRDDVEAYILKNHPQEGESRAGMQLARALQALMAVDARDREKSKVVADQGTRAVNCMYFAFPGPPTSLYPAHVSDLIMEKTFNTRDRKMANNAFSRAVDGTTSSLPNHNTCE